MDDIKSQMEPGAATKGDDRPIAAFDFDGTLTIQDSFRAYLAWKVGLVAYLYGYGLMIPAIARFVGDRDRGRLKAAMVAVYLRGMTRAEVEESADAFAETALPRLMRPDALAAWRRHKAEGHATVIVTASPDILVAPFARRLGADGLMGTRLAFDAADRVTRALIGSNCRGAEKVRRLHEAYGPDLRLVAAYGDTSGDTEMLAIAEHPGFRVFTAKP